MDGISIAIHFDYLEKGDYYNEIRKDPTEYIKKIYTSASKNYVQYEVTRKVYQLVQALAFKRGDKFFIHHQLIQMESLDRYELGLMMHVNTSSIGNIGGGIPWLSLTEELIKICRKSYKKESKGCCVEEKK